VHGPGKRSNIATSNVIFYTCTLWYVFQRLCVDQFTLRIACLWDIDDLLHAVGGFVPGCRVLEAPVEMTSGEACLDAVALLARLVWTARIRPYPEFMNVTIADEPLISLTRALNVIEGLLQLLSSLLHLFDHPLFWAVHL